MSKQTVTNSQRNEKQHSALRGTLRVKGSPAQLSDPPTPRMSVGKLGQHREGGKHRCPSRLVLTCKCLYGYRLLTGAFWEEACCCCVYLSPWSYKWTREARWKKERWMTKKRHSCSEWTRQRTKRKKKGVSQKAFTIQVTTGFTLIRMCFRTQCSDGQRSEHEFRHIPQANPHFATFNFMQSQHLERECIWKANAVHSRKQKNIKR